LTASDLDLNFAFYIEDPIDLSYNPGYTILTDSQEYKEIIFKFQSAYKIIGSKNLKHLFPEPENEFL